MRIGKALVPYALAALVGGCSVEPARPLATVRVPPPPMVVPPAPIVVAPAAYHGRHPGRGWGHRHHRHHHDD